MGLGKTFFVKSTLMYFITLCKEDLWFFMQSINLHMTNTKHIAHRALRYLNGKITLVWCHYSHHLFHWVPQVPQICRTAYFWQMKLTIFTHRNTTLTTFHSTSSCILDRGRLLHHVIYILYCMNLHSILNIWNYPNPFSCIKIVY